MDREPTFMSASSAAAHLGVPANWLKIEAEAGRVPFIRAGARILFNPVLVEQALAKRAAMNLSRAGGSDDAH